MLDAELRFGGKHGPIGGPGPAEVRAEAEEDGADQRGEQQRCQPEGGRRGAGILHLGVESKSGDGSGGCLWAVIFLMGRWMWQSVGRKPKPKKKTKKKHTHTQILNHMKNEAEGICSFFLPSATSGSGSAAAITASQRPGPPGSNYGGGGQI